MICITISTEKKSKKQMEKKYLAEVLFNLDILAQLTFWMCVITFGLTGIWLLFWSDGAAVEKIECVKSGLRGAAAVALLCLPPMVLIPRRKHLKKLLGITKNPPAVNPGSNEAEQK